VRARLAQAETELARRENQAGPRGFQAQTNAFGELSDVVGLLRSPLRARVRLALARAVAAMPGARVNERARDSLGRAGVAISASHSPAYEELIFGRATGELLATAPDTVVVSQGVVDSAHALPKGVKPINPAGGPPTPLTPTISPVVGNVATTFRLTLPSPGRRSSRRPPALDWMLIGTPSDGCLGGFLPRLVPLVASAHSRRASAAEDAYMLGPAQVHRRAWCPGRYELTLLPRQSRRSRAAFPSQSTLLGLGSSIYFRVGATSQ
jgi:hypothetical protein